MLNWTQNVRVFFMNPNNRIARVIANTEQYMAKSPIDVTDILRQNPQAAQLNQRQFRICQQVFRFILTNTRIPNRRAVANVPLNNLRDMLMIIPQIQVLFADMPNLTQYQTFLQTIIDAKQAQERRVQVPRDILPNPVQNVLVACNNCLTKGTITNSFNSSKKSKPLCAQHQKHFENVLRAARSWTWVYFRKDKNGAPLAPQAPFLAKYVRQDGTSQYRQLFTLLREMLLNQQPNRVIVQQFLLFLECPFSSYNHNIVVAALKDAVPTFSYEIDPIKDVPIQITLTAKPALGSFGTQVVYKLCGFRGQFRFSSVVNQAKKINGKISAPHQAIEQIQSFFRLCITFTQVNPGNVVNVGRQNVFFQRIQENDL